MKKELGLLALEQGRRRRYVCMYWDSMLMEEVLDGECEVKSVMESRRRSEKVG